ncbi:MAG: transposase, partial [Paracoccaceae bacterium]
TDHDARWIKKGHKSILGYKSFARCDEEGFVDKIHTTPTNLDESPQFESMIERSNAQSVLADKAYASKAIRDALKGKHRDSILHKAVRGRLCVNHKNTLTS